MYVVHTSAGRVARANVIFEVMPRVMMDGG